MINRAFRKKRNRPKRQKDDEKKLEDFSVLFMRIPGRHAAGKPSFCVVRDVFHLTK